MDPVAMRVRERFLLLETLDFWCCVVSFMFCVFVVLAEVARHYKWRQAAQIACDVLSYLCGTAVLFYIFWRVFFAWKGIYYP